MAAGMRAGAAGIPHVLGQGCPTSRPSGPLWTPHPSLFLLSSSLGPPTATATARGKCSIPLPHGPPVPLQWIILGLLWPEGRQGVFTAFTASHLLGVLALGGRSCGSPLGEAAEGLCHWEGMWGAQSKPWDSQGDAGSKSAFKKTSGWWQGVRETGKHSFSSSCNSAVKRYELSEEIWWFNLQLQILTQSPFFPTSAFACE